MSSSNTGELRTDHRIAYFHMLWASLAFAVMASVSHLAGERSDWQLVVVARAAVAFFFAFIIAKVARVKLILFGSRTLWVRSLAGSTGMLCNFYALAHLPVSDTLTLMNTSPIWVTLILWLVFKQKPTANIGVAVLVSVIGIALIQQPHFQSGKFACLMALCGAFCTSIAMLGLNRLQHIDPRAIVVHFSGVASLATTTFLLATNRKDYSAQLTDKTTLLLLVLVGVWGVAGQIGMTMAFAKGQATQISVVALSQILFGLVFDVLFWNHAVNALSLLGMVMVVVPTAWLILSRTPKQSHDLTEVEMED
ncbi:MAG: DMT family transporter [Acidobacteria bacterium]|nr:DMT family transporter [Acidobacteriota bacterium]